MSYGQKQDPIERVQGLHPFRTRRGRRAPPALAFSAWNPLPTWTLDVRCSTLSVRHEVSQAPTPARAPWISAFFPRNLLPTWALGVRPVLRGPEPVERGEGGCSTLGVRREAPPLHPRARVRAGLRSQPGRARGSQPVEVASTVHSEYRGGGKRKLINHDAPANVARRA